MKQLLIARESPLFLPRNYRKWRDIIVALVFQVLVLAVPVNSQTVVNVFDTTAFGSPDPSGLTFLPDSSALLLSDSEVEKNPFFGGDNIFQLSLSGNLLLTQSTLGFSREPAGVAFNTATGTLFVSDDDLSIIFEVDPVTLEVLSSFSTIDAGCWDAEDVSFDPATGNLFVAGGASHLICEFTFDGVFVSSFAVPEINDPEGIAFDSASGNLFIGSGPFIFEVTRGGVLVRVIDMRPFGVTVLKAMTFAPSSDPNDDPTILNLYVADYGKDEVNDGRVFEISLPDGAEQDPSPLYIVTTSLKNGALGMKYRATLKAKLGVIPYIWSVVAGALPPGLTLKTNLESKGIIKGIPLEVGSFDVTFGVTDSLGGIAEKTFTITIKPQ